MVKLDDAVIARFSDKEEHFEMLVDPKLALEVKQGKDVRLDDLLAIDRVFKDSKKGTEQSPEAITKTFHSDDPGKIVKHIILHGEVQLTTEQKKEIREKKFNEIVAYISRNSMNPQTNAPHPPVRIENALNELRITVDEFKSVNDQIPKIVDELKKLIPLSFSKLEAAIKVPAEFTGKACAELHEFKVVKEEWQADGSLILLVEIPAGLKNDLISKVGKLTQGKGECKFLQK